MEIMETSPVQQELQHEQQPSGAGWQPGVCCWYMKDRVVGRGWTGMHHSGLKGIGQECEENAMRPDGEDGHQNPPSHSLTEGAANQK